MARGDHIRVSRGAYWHHGIDLGDGTVIHYNGTRKSDALVKRSLLRDFAKGARVEVVNYKKSFDPDKVILRAKLRVGEGGYSVLWNNCEHFARWCKIGKAVSNQVGTGVAVAKGSGSTAFSTAAGIKAVAALGTAAGLSGAAGTMSGLATIGSVVGGGATAGVGLLAAAPTAAVTAVVHKRLRDDPNLPREERRARKAGRQGTVIGGGLGLAGSAGALYSAGTVGLSATGITSGLAAIGGAFGMVGGVAILACAPAAVAGLLGYLFYRKNSRRA